MIGKQFVYADVRLSEDRATAYFDYTVETDSETFDLTESLKFPAPLPQTGLTDKLLRALHLALGISYYKTFIPPSIEHPYLMSESEAGFWNEVFQNGLGEFLFINKLGIDDLAKFHAQDGKNIEDLQEFDWQESALLGIGGGKDSIVAGELLKELGIQTTGFVLATGNNTGQAAEVAEVMQVGLLQVERKLDRQILEMNKLDGAYNGHVPISLVFALIGCLLASTENARYVIVANEASASIPQTEGANGAVNHQWSKSLEFERMFQDFIHTYVCSELTYFSIIRPLNSVAIAKLFSAYPKYFEVFTSDNSVFRIVQGERDHPRWSLESPKTLSSFILLGPWLTDDQLLSVFGRNLLDYEELANLLLELLGESDEKVLDCVGTPEELRLSLSLLDKQERFQATALMQLAKNKGLLSAESSDWQSLLALEDEHALPNNLQEKIVTVLKEKIS
jgi:hypothetical protein